MAIWTQPTVQRYMWSTMVTRNPMVLEDIMVRSDILMNPNYMFIKYINPNMVSSNTMGIRVNMVDHMSLCNHGLSYQRVFTCGSQDAGLVTVGFFFLIFSEILKEAQGNYSKS